MIVDDEKPARELLKMSLNWEELGFAPPEEASNGEQALEEYRNSQPDFVITDIQMPVMGGLEMIAEIRRINPDQRIVILSCHESFTFAKQAIRLGVVDYLIKDELDPRALAEILLAPSSHENEPESVPYPDMSLLEPLFTGHISWDDAARELDKKLRGGGEFFCCHVNGATVFSGQLRRVHHSILETCGGDLCRTESGDLAVLLFCPEHISRMQDTKEKNHLLWMLRSMLEEGNAGPYTIGVSNAGHCGADLSRCLQEARMAARCSVFYGAGRTIFYDEQQSCMRESSLDRMNERLARVICAVDQGDRETARRELTNLYRRDLPGMMQVNYLQHINMLLLTNLTSRCIQQRIPFERVFGSKTLSALPEDCSTAEEMLQWYLHCFDEYFAQISHHGDMVVSPKVESAVRYIDQNLDQEMSLEIVADHFGLHKVYLAKIFKKELGCSVNEYIRSAKTARAKELLAQRSMKINEIAPMLGFNNTQTFYNVFKSCAGISPSEYREQLEKQRQQ